ncbi:MAG TPA: allophanate hydrolase [Caldimonas sp.]
MDPPPLLTLADWRAAYASGAAPRELLMALQRRLEVETPAGIWITRADRPAIEAQVEALEARAARHADRAAALRELPLFGVPFAVKDNIDVAGLPTTAACPAFSHVPVAHAGAVAKLIAAGAVCIGKTNLDQFATGLVGTRSPYGRPSCALAAGRISGGSSSGSAVAVARGDVAFALGTDTAGSGRVPAGFNNVVGLKPTPGRVGTSGVVPACRSIDCLSILALTAADAAQVLALVEGPDGADAYSAFATGPARLPQTLRVGIPTQTIFSGDAGYGPAYEKAVAHLQGLGHGVLALDFAPLHAVAELLYGGPWVAERHAVVEALLDTRPEALDPSVRSVIAAARTLTATDAFRGLHTLRAAQRDNAALWSQVDLLMVPTAPGHPHHGEVDADPIGVNAQLGTYTNFVNLLGWCALALPAGFASNGLPFGVTFIAPAASDAALARFGVAWQASLDLPLGATTARRSATAESALAGPWPASAATLPIAVVGAHLSGLPLNAQLLERGATLREATHTAPHYRLFALPGTNPPKPGMVRAAQGGAAIAVEVWDMPLSAVGSFLASIPAPLGLGSVVLAGGHRVHGFLCEPHALEGATDITAHGGWRAWLASLRADEVRD